MGEVQGAYVKGARFKSRLENEARAGVRFISPRRRGKTACVQGNVVPFHLIFLFEIVCN